MAGTQPARDHRRRDDARRVKPGRVAEVTAIIAGGGFAALLVVYGFTGLFVRPTSDDWCFFARERTSGMTGLVIDMYVNQNGRASTGAALALVAGLPAGPQLFPALLIVTAVAANFTLATGLAHYLSFRWPRLMRLALACGVTLVQFASFGNTYQKVLWAPGAVSHSVAPTLFVLLTGTVLVLGVRATGLTGLLLIAIATSAVALFNEVFALVLGLTTGMVFLLHLLYCRRSTPLLRYAAAVAVGAASGFLALWFSPGAVTRRGIVEQGESPLDPAVRNDVLDQSIHVARAVGSSWTVYAVVLLGILTGTVLQRRNAAWSSVGARRVPLAAWVLAPLVVTVAAGVLLVLALRLGYGVNGYLFSRAYPSFFFFWVLTLSFYGVLLGVAAANLARRIAWGPLVVGSLVAVALVGLAAASFQEALKLRDLTSAAVLRAQAWDQQDRRIREEVRSGADTVVYVPTNIAGLAEPFLLARDRDWVASCVEDYYDVGRITQSEQRPS